MEFVLATVWDRIERDLLNLKENVRISNIKADIDIILEFLNKNKQIMHSSNQLARPRTKVSTSMQSKYRNQEVMNELNQSELGEEEFEAKKKQLLGL